MADHEGLIVVAPPTLTKSGNGVKKRERKAGKALAALSYGVRRSVRLVVAESLEYARAANAKAPSTLPTPAPTSSSSLSSAGIRSTRSTRFTRSMLSTPSTPSSPSSPSTPSAPAWPNTTTTTTCTTPKTSERDEPPRSPLIPTQRKNWYCIKGIINEASRGGKTRYLVVWDGYDPATGLDWPAEWLDASAVSKPAIAMWKRERDEYMANN